MLLSTSLSLLLVSRALLAPMDEVPEHPMPTSADVPAAVAQAQGKLAQVLDHYPEARFRNVRVVARPMTDGSYRVTFCGEIDGPNRLGGRSGFEPFRLIPDASFGALFVDPADGCPGQRIDQTDYSRALTAKGQG